MSLRIRMAKWFGVGDENLKNSSKMSGTNDVSDTLIVGESKGIENNEIPTSKYNLAELICYHHREGLSTEELCELVDKPREYVEGVIREAKESGFFNFLADKLKR